MKDKLVSFPEEVLKILDDYKKKTGIPATDYIRNAVCIKMIEEKLMFFHTKYINVEVNGENNKKTYVNIDAIESNKFCDGDKCELPALLEKC